MPGIASKEDITNLIKEQIASVTKSDINSFDENVNFIKCGISSIQAIMIINKIKKKLQIDINPIAMFEHKNIFELSNYLNECINNG